MPQGGASGNGGMRGRQSRTPATAAALVIDQQDDWLAATGRPPASRRVVDGVTEVDFRFASRRTTAGVGEGDPRSLSRRATGGPVAADARAEPRRTVGRDSRTPSRRSPRPVPAGAPARRTAAVDGRGADRLRRGDVAGAPAGNLARPRLGVRLVSPLGSAVRPAAGSAVRPAAGSAVRPAAGSAARRPAGSPARRRRPTSRPYERSGFEPDRVAMWAVLLGVLLVLVAATSSHAALRTAPGVRVVAPATPSRSPDSSINFRGSPQVLSTWASGDAAPAWAGPYGPPMGR